MILDLHGGHGVKTDPTPMNEAKQAAQADGADNKAKVRTKRVLTKAEELDQYYTRPEIVALCMEYVAKEIPMKEIATWLEPSAGTGAFLTCLPTPRIGLDIDAEHKHDEVLTADFKEWKGGPALSRPVVTIGNPPFGRNASDALQFVNIAATFSDWICMILPRTFDKVTMQNKINLNFELVKSHRLPADSFLHEDRPYDVPCCFQIWRRLPTGEKRTRRHHHRTHQDFKFVGQKEKPHFAFQRVGANAGLASTEGLDKSWKSNHFIRVNDGVDPKKVMDALNSIDWSGISGNTAGNPSISKGEMIEAYSRLSPREETDLFAPVK